MSNQILWILRDNAQKEIGDMTQDNDNGSGLLGVLGAAAAIGGAAALLLNTEKGKEILQKGKELGDSVLEGAQALGEEISTGAKEFGDSALEKGIEIATTGVEALQDGLNAFKERLKKTDKPAD
jgi:gas vesicle protein